jgi:Rrf2 family iron-sulfur cluster assembly transcriptional regulator
MLSNTCKYAIRAVVFLAVNEKKNTKIGIKKISDDIGIPMPFLGKILQVLSKNKILNSTKGPNGGFCLAIPAKDINLITIIKIIDGLDLFKTCIIGMKICKDDDRLKKDCPFHETFDSLRDDLYKKFKSVTIEHFKKGLKNFNGLLTI